MPRTLNKEEVMRFRLVVNGNEAQKQLFDLEKRTRSLKEETKALKDDRKKLSREGKRGSAEYKKLTASIKENETTLKKNRTEMNRLQKEIGITGLTMGQLRQRARFLRQTLNNLVPGSADYKRYDAELKAINARMRQLRVSSTAGRSSLLRLADGFNRFAALGASVIATTTGVMLSFQKLIDFNGKLSDAMANVQRTTGLTSDEVDELTKSFGALNTRTSRIELLKLSETAGRLGFSDLKDIQAFAENMNMIKVALEGDLTEKQILDVGKMVDVYKVATKESTDYHNALNKLGSAINEVSKAGNNQASFQVEFLKRSAGVAASANLTAETMLGYAAAFDEAGQSAEISGTAMNKVIINMFDDTQTFAKIAGVELDKFNKILNEDTDAAFKLFLKGLKGNNDGFKIMVQRLKELDAGGARGVAALTALANNLDVLEARQKTANAALKEGTSLSTEYELKNNTLAATLQKISRRMRGLFITDGMKQFVNESLSGFGRMIGAIKDVNEEFAKVSERTYNNAKANQRLASESSKLLDEYKALTREGIEPSAEEKQRLEMITLQLSDRLGESVFTINEETGAYELNTEAVREQIKIKRLAADDEASTLASRLMGAKQEIERLKDQEDQAKRLLDLRKQIFEEANPDDTGPLKSDPFGGGQRFRETLSGYQEMREASLAYQKVVNDLNEQEDRRADLLKKLRNLNFNEEDIYNLFKIPDNSDRENAAQPDPIDAILPDADSPKVKERLTNLSRLQNDLERLQNDNARNRANLEEDAFIRELELEDARYAERIQQLQKHLTDESELKELAQKRDQALAAGDTERFEHFREELRLRREANQSVLDAMATDQETHEFKVAQIIERAQANEIQKKQEQYEREKRERDTAFNNELAQISSLGAAKAILRNTLDQKELSEIKTLSDAKKAITAQHRNEELKRQAEYLKEVIGQMDSAFAQGLFKGFDLDILNAEQTEALKDRIDELKEKLSGINSELAKVRGQDDDAGFGLGIGDANRPDIFGMTPTDWEDMFNNFTDSEKLLQNLANAVGVVTQIWGQYNQMRNAADKKRLQEFKERTEEEKRLEKQRLDQGFINQRQYNKRVEKLEEQQKRKEAEVAYKQAKRDKQVKITEALANGALAVTNALATVHPFPAALVAASLATAMTGMQVATIAKQPLPARGFEDGLYNVAREQDGKHFKAPYKGYSKSGLTDGPSLFLAGEEGRHRPEMIINGTDYNNFDPGFKQALNSELRRVRGFEDGLYPDNRNTTQSVSNTDDSAENAEREALLIAVLKRNSDILEKIERNGVPAYLVRTMRNARDIQEDIEDYNRTRERARI